MMSLKMRNKLGLGCLAVETGFLYIHAVTTLDLRELLPLFPKCKLNSRHKPLQPVQNEAALSQDCWHKFHPSY